MMNEQGRRSNHPLNDVPAIFAGSGMGIRHPSSHIMSLSHIEREIRNYHV
jgi:hypothetical protein